MSQEMIEDVLSVTKNALKAHKIEKDIAHSIKTEFDNKFGSTWHCIVGKDFGSFVTHQSNHFIYFYLEGLAFLLFKT